MQMRRLGGLVLALSLALAVVPGGALAGPPSSRGSGELTFQEFVVPNDVRNEIRREWTEDLLAKYPAGSWAPLRFEPTDAQLARMGLPSREILLSRRYPVPTMVTKGGRFERVKLPPVPTGTLGPTVASYAGAGWFGIRPGAWLLLLTGGIGWCTTAHVYGSPGAYKISTAGHCGKVGDTATVIAAFGNRNSVLNPILLDFGKFGTAQDGGLGNDYALIPVDAPWQNLVSPTMAFWGGPRGVYTKTGSTVAVKFPRRGLIPTLTVNPDPLLAQVIVHYGHGTGVGTGGTPRAGTAIHWGASHFMFEGVISPGDPGSGANALTGDTAGANMEAAGIITHIWIDLLMRQGIGIMGGTRVTKVGTPANGQFVPYPVPAPGLP